MKDEKRRKSELIRELKSLRKQNKELEANEFKRKQIEELLREDVERWRLLVTNSPDFIAVHDQDGRYLYLNHYVEGFSEQNVLGKMAFDFILEESRELYKIAFNQCVRTMKKQQAEYGAMGDFGKKRIYESTFVPMVNQGNEINVLVVARDITARKQAEENLQKSEARYRSLFENSLMGISAASPDGRLIHANQAYAQMYGYENPETMIAAVKNVGQQLYANQEDREEVLRILAEHGAMEPKEMEVVRRDGTRLFVLVSANEVRDSSGKLLYLQAIHTDISKRKNIEEQLRTTVSEYKELFDNSGTGIIIIDRDGKYLRANKRCAKVLGKEVEEVVGKSIFDFLPFQTAKKYLEANRSLIESGGHRDYEGTFLMAGSEKTFLIVDQVLQDANGHGYALQSSSIDITERKRVEEALRESEEKFAKTFYSSPNLMAITTPQEGRIIEINDAYCRLLGYGRDGCLNHTTAELRIWADSEQRNRVVQIIKEHGRAQNIETALRKKSGEIVSVVLSMELVTIHSQEYFLSVATDITERKQAEKRLLDTALYVRSLIEANLDPLVTISPSGKIMDVNRATEEATGVVRNDLIGKDFTDYFMEPEKAKTGYRRVLEEGQVKDYPLTLRHTTGKTTDVLYNATVYRNEEGTIQGVFAAARDITERKRAEEEISKSQKEFRMLANHLQNIREEERKRLAREFHDQLGQSMTALKMDLSLLLRMVSDKKQDVPRNHLAEELRSMQKLVDETINLIWIIISELRPQMLEDLGLVNTLEWEAKQFETRTGISCEFKSLSGDIQVDANKSIALFRIYQEALTNVGRHAHATAVKSILRSDQEMMILEINDNGCGISNDMESKPGSFGLLGMRERALAFEGEVEISGIGGKGTSIIVRLPLG